MKFTLITLLAGLATTSAFAPSFGLGRITTSHKMSGDEEEPTLGSGGMADTRDPETKEDEDPRKSISAAPSFEEYMKQRDSA